MAIVHEPAAARVMVVGKDPLITRVLSKLLELDEHITPLGEAPSIGTAPISELRPDIVILDEEQQPVDAAQTKEYLQEIAPGARLCLLDELRGCTVDQLLTTVKLLAPTLHGAPQRPRLKVLAPPVDGEALGALSEREMEVVRLVAEGLSNKEISTRLSLSDKTVKNHISHILAKMNLTARTQVAVYALRAGIV